MAETLYEHINNLRKRSRLLLTQVDVNSKKIRKELKKLHSKSLTQRENYRYFVDGQNLNYRGNIESWKLRNDSSGVNGILHPDYFYDSPNHTVASMPTVSTSKRVLVSSKKPEGQCCLGNIQRKPIRECYCYPEIKKAQLRSSRTQRKQDLSCKHCKSYIDINSAKDKLEKQLLNSPISCETLQRVQKIDYTPRSQFLRNVQSKVSFLQGTSSGDCPETRAKSLCYHELMNKKNTHNVDSIHQLSTTNGKSQSSIQVSKPRLLHERVTNLEYDEECSESEKEFQVSQKKQSKPKLVIKRTLSSKKSVPELKKTNSKVKISKNKRTLQGLNKECPCCNNKLQYSKTNLEKNARSSIDEDYQHIVCINAKQEDSHEEYFSDDEVKKLRKFREQNYFDTHGSSHTLLSSKSSGSLEQYFLNERLFPEPGKRIHKKDLVVTMPACATVQRKRMHYFPRYVVHQEKNNCNTSYTKKRHQSCPLTGHAIDLGVTKIRPPLNSLALKYQKRLT